MRSWPAAVALSAALLPAAVGAQTPAPPAPASASAFTTRASLKSSVLLSRAPDAPALFPDRYAATNFWRGRIEPVWRPNARWSVAGAYEQRLRLFSSSSMSAVAIGGDALPSAVTAPYRLTPLDWEIASSSHSTWYHEIDRAAVQLRLPAAEITAGRQAVGWGRGVLFSAVDVFLPFSPLDPDREWRRGIDALRADVRLSRRASVEVVGAFGEAADESVYGARLRGYTERADAEVTAGWRAGDRFAGVSSSFALGGAEWHGEAAVFDTPAVAGSAFFGAPRTIVKTVFGGSCRFPLGTGLFVESEYHYSGFGAADASQTLALLSDPEFVKRYVRADTQMLGRHALAVTASYEWSPLMAGGLMWLQDPTEGSGLAQPSLTITPGDRWSLFVCAYLPYSRAAGSPLPHSQFGLTPTSLFAQLRIYR